MLISKIRLPAVVVCVLGLLMSPGFASAEIRFLPYDLGRAYPVRGELPNPVAYYYPVAVNTADFNGDGYVDIATADYQAGRISVLLNDGNGEYLDFALYPLAGDPIGLTTGDVDGDGDVDVATANYTSSSISILLNDGSGAFGTSTEYAVANNPQNVSFGDVDGDGDLDLGVVQAGGDTVILFQNDGSGEFTEGDSYVAGSSPRDVAFADLDGDGDQDMVVAATVAGQFSVFLNAGDGSFADAASYLSGGTYPLLASLADMDGDGDLDIFGSNISEGNLVVLKNNGDATFAEAVVSADLGDSANDIAAGDLDGDGDVDAMLVVNSIHVLEYLNDGTGAFTTNGIRYVGSRSTNSVSINDLDADGDNDFVTTGGLGDSVTVHLNPGNGGFPQGDTIPIGNYTGSALAADLNDDGFDDIAVGSYFANAVSATSVHILLSNGDGTFQTPAEYPTEYDPSSMQAVDVDGDGDLDIGMGYLYGGAPVRFGIMFNDGDGTFSAPVNYDTGFISEFYAVGGLAFADYDLDGDPDVAMTTGEENAIYIYENDGHGVFSVQDSYDLGQQTRSVVVSDFDGDGDPDLAVTEWPPRLTILLNDDGHFTQGQQIEDFPTYISDDFPYPEFLWDMRTADLNGDGSSDLVVTGNNTNSMYVFMSNGDGTFASSTRYHTNRWAQGIDIKDIDGDGDLDVGHALYVFNGGGFFLNNGDGTFADVINTSSIFRSTEIAFGDFDGNGRWDYVLTTNHEYGINVVWNTLPDLPPPPPTPPIPSGNGALGAPGVPALPPLVTIPSIVLPCILPASFIPSHSSYYVLSCDPLLTPPTDIPSHSLIKIPSNPAVYYLGIDKKRHAFPSDKVYFTWYENFNQVQLVSEDQLSSIPLGANVTYKPGKRMVKFVSDPRVYVVDRGGVLRWVISEQAAQELYGSSWNTMIDDINDAFYTNYVFGTDIGGLSDFDPMEVQGSVSFPSESLGV